MKHKTRKRKREGITEKLKRGGNLKSETRKTPVATPPSTAGNDRDRERTGSGSEYYIYVLGEG